jgi:putative peptidoglycan lipid II flippase
VSAFTIAFSLLQIPIGIIGVPLGVVLFPSLARDAAEGDETAYQGLLGRALRAIVIVMLPIAVMSAILRDELVALVFAPSDIDAADAALIAATLLVLLAGLVAHALIAVLARAFYARHDTLTPVAMAIVAVAVNTTLAFALVGSQGLPGIAAAIAVGAWIEALGLLILLHRRFHGWDLRPLASVSARALVAAAIGAAAGIVVRTVLDGTGPGGTGFVATVWLVVQIGLVTASVGVAYAGAALALRIDDLRSIVGLMVAAFRRPRAT